MKILFQDAVIDSYRHFSEELGKIPRIDDIFTDLENNYNIEDFNIENLDIKIYNNYCNDIMIILNKNHLTYEK